MKVHIITPFPDMVNSIIGCSILGKAHERGCVEYQIYNLFDFLENSTNKRIDDYPFGGGPGMILKPEPIFEAFNFIKQNLDDSSSVKVIYPTPASQPPAMSNVTFKTCLSCKCSLEKYNLNIEKCNQSYII